MLEQVNSFTVRKGLPSTPARLYCAYLYALWPWMTPGWLTG